jgi:hypothetical protein
MSNSVWAAGALLVGATAAAISWSAQWRDDASRAKRDRDEVLKARNALHSKMESAAHAWEKDRFGVDCSPFLYEFDAVPDVPSAKLDALLDGVPAADAASASRLRAAIREHALLTHALSLESAQRGVRGDRTREAIWGVVDAVAKRTGTARSHALLEQLRQEADAALVTTREGSTPARLS